MYNTDEHLCGQNCVSYVYMGAYLGHYIVVSSSDSES
jgi:hypothetical protein